MNECVIGEQQIRPLEEPEAAVPATVKTHGTVQPWPLTPGGHRTHKGRVLGGERRVGTHTPM